MNAKKRKVRKPGIADNVKAPIFFNYQTISFATSLVQQT